MDSSSASHAAHAAAKGEEMPQFAAVLTQLNYHNMAPLASQIRQSIESTYDGKFTPTDVALWHSCSVSPEPLNGSYNLAYVISFEDGAQWMFKIPANGHYTCFDRLAAEALTSEAMTMRLIRQRTTVPIPNIHHFDASCNNSIGCPYILMDFLKGKPLWHGWFDEESSRSSVEQFRARSMQTIAAAMVQLSQFTVDRGGFVRFESDGRPVDVTAARVPDWLAGSDIQQGLATAREGCLYCKKGPINDAAASFLFMLDRRGVREGDGPLELGSQEIVRMFTQWTLEKAENANDSRRKFVLAHPDFAFQNFLVEDDGTLCGIIDWDGVAAVPLAIGCLKYPDWLTSDWHPLYDYRPGVVGQKANSPEDLAIYRTMYAQFVEASSTILCGSSRAGKLTADITRRSLIAGSLDVGAQDPELTDKMIGIIFQKLERLTADDEDREVLDTGLGSSIGTGSNGVNEEDSGGDTTPTEIEDSIRIDEKDDKVANPCSKSTAGLEPQSPPTNFDDELDASRHSTPHTTRFDGPSSGPEHELMFLSDGSDIEKKARDQTTSCSPKTRLAKWALSLGKKGSKMLVDSLHKKEPRRKVRAIKWALNMGEKCCKGASEIFHKENWPQSLPVQNSSDSILRAVNPAAGICKRIETSQSNFATSIHPDCIPSNEESKSKNTMTERIQAWVNWLIELLKKSILKSMILKPIDDDVGGVQTPAAAGRQSSAHVVRLNEQHFQGCDPRGEGSRGCESLRDGVRFAGIDSQDVWAGIAAEIHQGGVPVDLIEKRREMIVQCVIQILGDEIQQEKNTNSLANAHDLTTLENIEEANRKLRTLLSSFEEPRGPGTNLCSESIQAVEAHRIPIEEMDHAKAERFGRDFETSESDHQKLQDTLSSLNKLEAVTTDPWRDMIQVVGDVDGFDESRNQSQTLATKPKVNAGSNVVSVQNPNNFKGGKWCETSRGIVAVQTPTKVKHGWWFLTAGGSLKRTKTQKMLDEKAYGQEWTSSSQLAISNHQVPKAVNVFQVPDDDEDISEYDTGGSTYGENERKVGNSNATGNFNPYDVCVALGKGKLDERRMNRLNEGFIALLDDAVGGYRRIM